VTGFSEFAALWPAWPFLYSFTSLYPSLELVRRARFSPSRADPLLIFLRPFRMAENFESEISSIFSSLRLSFLAPLSLHFFRQNLLSATSRFLVLIPRNERAGAGRTPPPVPFFSFKSHFRPRIQGLAERISAPLRRAFPFSSWTFLIASHSFVKAVPTGPQRLAL